MSTIKIVNTTKTKKNRGRPAKFDREQVVESAKQLFCENGFEGTSIAQLCEASKLKPPSLYAIFNDKETLFCEVLRTYHAPYKESLRQLFEEPISTIEALTKLLLLNKTHLTSASQNGCLIANSSIQVKADNHTIADVIQALHNTNENMISDRIDKGKLIGDVAQSLDARAIARFINGVIQGSAVLARGQQSDEAVTDLIQTTIDTLDKLLLGKEINHDNI